MLADERGEALVLDEDAAERAAGPRVRGLRRAGREAREVRRARVDVVRRQGPEGRDDVPRRAELVDRRARATEVPVVDDDRAAGREGVATRKGVAPCFF